MRIIDDKVAFIKEIQRFLIKVTPEGDGVIWESGVYDEITKNAIRRFKSENGLAIDTVVDYETFDLLYLKYLSSDADKNKTLKRGDRGDDVLELNAMLVRVGAEYSEFYDYPKSDYFSENTERAVIHLKERFGLIGDGSADGIFVERLKREYLLVKEFE